MWREFPCWAALHLAKEVMEYSTETKPTVLGSYLNTDVLEEAGQRILVIRDKTTLPLLQPPPSPRTNQSQSSGTLTLSLKLRKSCVIRTYPHPSFKNLKDDPYLKSVSLTLNVCHSKNVNKNGVAEKAIRELREEIIWVQQLGGPLSSATLTP